MSDKIVLETKDLTKNYDGVTVVDRLNLQVRENEIFGLLGPNGAGKTTTILMLLGLTEPVSGSAQVYGYNPTREPLKVKRLAGYLPETIGFYDSLTPKENLKFIAELNNINEAEANRKIDELLELVGISEAADLTVGKFSRGMKQRLGLAQTLLHDPPVLILDEPGLGLDPRGVVEFRAIIEKAGQEKTIFFASHQLTEVTQICKQVAIIDHGRLLAFDSIATLKKKYKSLERAYLELTEAPLD